MTGQLYEVLHLPAVGIVYLWSGLSGANEGAWAAYPYAVTLQWVMLFAIVGTVAHYFPDRSQEHDTDA